MSSHAYPAIIFVSPPPSPTPVPTKLTNQNTPNYTQESHQTTSYTDLQTLRTIYSPTTPALLQLPILTFHIYKPASPVLDPALFTARIPQAIHALAEAVRARYQFIAAAITGGAGPAAGGVLQCPVFGAVVVGTWVKFFRYVPETGELRVLERAAVAMHLFWDATCIFKALEEIKDAVDAFFGP